MLTKDNTPDFDLSVFEMGNSAIEYLEGKFGIESRQRAEKALKKLDNDEMREIEAGQNMGTTFIKNKTPLSRGFFIQQG